VFGVRARVVAVRLTLRLGAWENSRNGDLQGGINAWGLNVLDSSTL